MMMMSNTNHQLSRQIRLILLVVILLSLGFIILQYNTIIIPNFITINELEEGTTSQQHDASVIRRRKRKRKQIKIEQFEGVANINKMKKKKMKKKKKQNKQKNELEDEIIIPPRNHHHQQQQQQQQQNSHQQQQESSSTTRTATTSAGAGAAAGAATATRVAVNNTNNYLRRDDDDNDDSPLLKRKWPLSLSETADNKPKEEEEEILLATSNKKKKSTYNMVKKHDDDKNDKNENNNNVVTTTNNLTTTITTSSNLTTTVLPPLLPPPASDADESKSISIVETKKMKNQKKYERYNDNNNNQNLTTNTTTNTTTTTTNNSFNNVSSSSSSTLLFDESKMLFNNYNISKLPQWMKEYFDWHHNQLILLKNSNSTNWNQRPHNFKYLIIRCTYQYDPVCGGTSDRLKPLPVLLRMAYETHRLLFIYWNRPYHLEEFLIPNKFNYTVPSTEFRNDLESIHYKQTKFLDIPQHTNTTVIVTKLQRQDGGQSLLKDFVTNNKNNTKKRGSIVGIAIKEESDYDYTYFYHDMFRYIFRMSPGLNKVVMKQMTSSGLIPGQYNAIHYRAFYAINSQSKDNVTTNKLNEYAINAINCATHLMLKGDRQNQNNQKQQLPKLYFASDSIKAMEYAQIYATSKNLSLVTPSTTTTNNNTTSTDPIHLDFASRNKSGNNKTYYKVEDYYDSFVDLFIMGNGNCVTYGQGGFGKYANLLSYNTKCSNTHYSGDNRRRPGAMMSMEMKKCQLNKEINYMNYKIKKKKNNVGQIT